MLENFEKFLTSYDKDEIKAGIINNYIFSDNLTQDESSYLAWLIRKADGKISKDKKLCECAGEISKALKWLNESK